MHAAIVPSDCLSSLYFNVTVVLKRKGEGTQEYFHWSHEDYSRYFQVIFKQGQEDGEANTGEQTAHPIIQHAFLIH